MNINDQEVGHLLFMRNSEGAEKKRFKWYQQEIQCGARVGGAKLVNSNIFASFYERSSHRSSLANFHVSNA